MVADVMILKHGHRASICSRLRATVEATTLLEFPGKWSQHEVSSAETTQK